MSSRCHEDLACRLWYMLQCRLIPMIKRLSLLVNLPLLVSYINQ